MKQSVQIADQAIGAGLGVAVTLPTMLAALQRAGLDPMGLILGLMSAVLMTFLLGSIDSRSKAFGGIGLAGLLAGYGAPVVGQVLLSRFPDMTAVLQVSAPLISIGIGGIAPTLIPIAMARLKRIVSEYGSRK